MDSEKIPVLVANANNPMLLKFAQEVGDTCVNTKNTPGNKLACAATLSCLLLSAGISLGKYVGSIVSAIDLADHLEFQRGWKRIGLDQPLQPGDLGVMDGDLGNTEPGIHHIYLVLTPDPQRPLIADNQGVAHPRPVGGGPMPGTGITASPTNYFLRAS